MAIYRYIVTVETINSYSDPEGIREEIDSNLESVIPEYGIEHFTVEQAPIGYWPGQGFKREGQQDV